MAIPPCVKRAPGGQHENTNLNTRTTYVVIVFSPFGTPVVPYAIRLSTNSRDNETDVRTEV